MSEPEIIVLSDCGCGQKAGNTSRTCGACKQPICADCRECSDLDASGDYCAPCFETEVS